MACAVNRQPLTAQTGFYPRPAHVGFVVDKLTMREAFLRVLRFYPLQIIPLLACNWQGPVFNNKIICAELKGGDHTAYKLKHNVNLYVINKIHVNRLTHG